MCLHRVISPAEGCLAAKNKNIVSICLDAEAYVDKVDVGVGRHNRVRPRSGYLDSDDLLVVG